MPFLHAKNPLKPLIKINLGQQNYNLQSRDRQGAGQNTLATRIDHHLSAAWSIVLNVWATSYFTVMKRSVRRFIPFSSGNGVSFQVRRDLGAKQHDACGNFEGDQHNDYGGK